MSLFIALRNFVAEPRLKGVDLDGDELIHFHCQILAEKKTMRDVFREFYDEIHALDTHYFSGDGKRVEVGAGVSLFKKFYPHIVSTDIKKAPHLDMALDAQNMPFGENSIRAIYGINCFHHFPDPEKFFFELRRVLQDGGGCILIEPYFGFFAAWFYERVFDTEHFNPHQPAWKNLDQGYMRGANQALSYIVFKRDAARFCQLFPDLEIVKMSPLPNYMRYLLSGGLNFRQLIPNFLAPVIKLLENLFSPLARIFGLHYTIVIRRKTRVASP